MCIFFKFFEIVKFMYVINFACFEIIIIPPLHRRGGILFYLCPSVRPSKIFFITFFSVTVKAEI